MHNSVEQAKIAALDVSQKVSYEQIGGEETETRQDGPTGARPVDGKETG
jgi:hypothetical protein